MKGHSERVPRKNLRSFCGEPLFFKVARELEKCAFIESIIIDTDSDEISTLAKKHFAKAKIVNRPEQLRGDDVPMNDIIAHDLTSFVGNFILQTHSTNPLLTSETLQNAWDVFQENCKQGYGSLFSVTRLQVRLYDSQLLPMNHNPNELLKTQDLKPVFEENSNFYFFTRDSFLKTNKRIGEKFKIFEVSKLEAFDIDTEIDFQLAEMVYKSTKKAI